MQADVDFLRSRDALFEAVVFDGGHAWHDEFRAAAGRLLATAEG